MGRIRILANAHVSIEKPDGDKYRHTLSFGRMLAADKVVYAEGGEYFDIHLVTGDVIREVTTKFFELHNGVKAEYPTLDEELPVLETETVDEPEVEDIIEDTLNILNEEVEDFDPEYNSEYDDDEK